ncbi:asparagine synthase (glutamine-hydrolyzing) [Pedobacter cryoconitis]|uniref:asparagine synthase (glutamine-hydrolyzing) n=2 Tax=Pedobacter cryoconitis TaxID=188932 RepID=A0A7W9DXN0_9SPHI|nr:asparagine synthase (glutamine-hydrolyzing) [Pedobacter cryoconitis]MBB6271708.1 asparagine synthase (glutamine-hydrolyzing) [Pedobacter cryoconitis]
MTEKLQHRGPDAEEVMVFDNISLGFTRLSIIGIDNGMQPIANEDESVVLICNGEIFNYIELREQLRQRGHRFRTNSDVEVILHLYEEQGMDFLNQLNGQFAFVIYDKKKRKMFCARDQFGIIPFYYTSFNHTFIFASEIKAILQFPGFDRQVDLTGLDQVFTFAGLISPRTMFKGVHSLENGHYLEVDETGKIANTEYWDLIYPEGEIEYGNKSESEYTEELEQLFEDSIALRLRADVPSAFYVSGGLDSSMILKKASSILSGNKLEGFSIDFVDSLNSESQYQKIIAESTNVNLHQKMFQFNDITTRLKQSIYHSECPIKETYNTSSLVLSESVRARGMKVVLSGEGADEFFAGYVGYRFDKMRQEKLITNTASEQELEIRRALWGDTDLFYEKDYTSFEAAKKEIYSAAVAEVYQDVRCLNHFIIDKSKIANRSIVNKRAYIDYKLRLVDHLVSDHGDKMAMANSIEVRYPFLDKNLIEYSTRLPCDLKLNGFTEKYILRKMAEKFVPEQIVNKEKFHFIAPGSPELLRQDIEYFNDLLSFDLIKKQGFFNPDKIEALKNEYRKPDFTINAPYENDLLITVLTFGILHETFFE